MRDDDGGRGFQKLHCHTLSSLPMSTLAISVQRKKERGLLCLEGIYVDKDEEVAEVGAISSDATQFGRMI